MLEVERPKHRRRSSRRNLKKSDPSDAEAAARAVLAGEASGVPKSGDGEVEMIRTLRAARRRSSARAKRCGRRTLQRSAAHSPRPVPPGGFRAPNSGLASYRSPALPRIAAMRRSEQSGTESSSLSAAEGARKGALAALTLRPPPALDPL